MDIKILEYELKFYPIKLYFYKIFLKEAIKLGISAYLDIENYFNNIL